MSPMAATYAVYLAITLTVTVWVGRSLFRGGRVFLVEIFAGDTTLADAINRLLLVGYYLVNTAFLTLALKTASRANSVVESIELLGDKVGLVLLVLGGMHFLNLLVFSRVRHYFLTRPLEIVDFVD